MRPKHQKGRLSLKTANHQTCIAIHAPALPKGNPNSLLSIRHRMLMSRPVIALFRNLHVGTALFLRTGYFSSTQTYYDAEPQVDLTVLNTRGLTHLLITSGDSNFPTMLTTKSIALSPCYRPCSLLLLS